MKYITMLLITCFLNNAYSLETKYYTIDISKQCTGKWNNDSNFNINIYDDLQFKSEEFLKRINYKIKIKDSSKLICDLNLIRLPKTVIKFKGIERIFSGLNWFMIKYNVKSTEDNIDKIDTFITIFNPLKKLRIAYDFIAADKEVNDFLFSSLFINYRGLENINKISIYPKISKKKNSLSITTLENNGTIDLNKDELSKLGDENDQHESISLKSIDLKKCSDNNMYEVCHTIIIDFNNIKI